MRTIDGRGNDDQHRDIRDRRDPAAPAAVVTAPLAAWNRSLRAAVATLAALIVLGVTACAGPPSGGPDHRKPLSQSHNNVFIVAREPGTSLTETQLVVNFLQALTGDQKDPTFSVAQDYLTDDARKSWTASGATDIVDNLGPQNVSLEKPGTADHSVRPPEAADPAPPPIGTLRNVYVTTQQVAALDEHGYYQAFLSPDSTLHAEFTLRYQKEGWRIQTAPKERLITEESFKRVYQTNQSAMPIYLPRYKDVPVDQVYLTQATGKVDYTYNKLAEAVLSGRTPGQRSALRLDETKPVTLSAQGVATVTLQTPSAGAVAGLGAVQEALLDTFTDAAATPQLVGSTPLQQVQVTYPGCTACAPTSVGTTANQATPPVYPAPPVYWVCPADGNRVAAVVSRVPGGSNSPLVCGDTPNTATQPVRTVVTVPKVAKDSPIAVRQPSAAAKTVSQAAVAAVVQNPDGSASVLVTDQGNPGAAKPWYNTSDPARVTDLEWDPVDDALWVVDSHVLYRVSEPHDKPSSSNADSVPVPSQAQLTGFKPSPDGTRAVLVTDPDATTGGAAPWPAAIVRIDRDGSKPSLDTVASPTPLLTNGSGALARATDAAWADGRTVVIAGKSGPASSPLRLFKVYSDGTQDSLISDSADAQPAAKHIAAATSTINGRPGVWLFSDGAGPAGSTTSNVYFKGRSGAESYQDSGWSPVVAMVALPAAGS